MDESRKQFERFLREEHLYTDEELAWEDDRNCYSIYPVHIAWKSWQASREAIEIKLPEACSCCYSESEKEWHYSVMSEVTDILTAAGIKVKG